MVAAKRTARGALIVLLAALVAITYAMRHRGVAAPDRPAIERIPLEIGGYGAEDEPLDGATLDVLGSDETLMRIYRAPGKPPIWLFIAYFEAPQENSQIHSPRHCYPGAGWTILAEGTTSVPIGGEARTVSTLVISNGAERHFVLYWFTGAEGVLATEFALKWSQMKSSLLGRSRATAFIRFSTEIETNDDTRAAGDALVRFAEECAPYIGAALADGGAASQAPAKEGSP